MTRLGLIAAFCCLSGCIAPGERLSFPREPARASSTERWYDVNANGAPDFGLRAGDSGRLDTLVYDDDEDGSTDRSYRLADYAPDDVPHLIVLMDSIPFRALADRWRDANWTWFDPPQKVIPPFPTMSPVIFSRMVGAPPMLGAINKYYDRHTGGRVDRIFHRATGERNAWERRLHFRLKYWENGLAFLDPRRWFRTELSRAKRAFDRSPDRITLVYFASTAGMLSRYGSDGLQECLDGLDQLCMQILHERRGAVKISALADHGHNLREGRRIDVPAMLRAAGFRPTGRLRAAADVVVEQDGLVNYVGIHTRRPSAVADALVQRPEIDLVMYPQGAGVVVRRSGMVAAIEHREDRFAYRMIEGDPLDYQAVIDALRATGRADADGYAAPSDWFDGTIDHQWPDAPRRIWEAFRIMAISTPDVMVTTRPGFYVGLPSFDLFIDMASTHGGLDQQDSATFVLTMTGRATRPMRTEEVLRTVEPGYDPSVLRR